MKNTGNVLTSKKFGSMTKKALTIFLTALAMTALCTCFASAGTGDAGKTIIEKLGDILTELTKWVGIGVAGIGAYELIIAFTQQQPEAKVKGITLAMVGVVLVTSGHFIKDLMSSVGG